MNMFSDKSKKSRSRTSAAHADFQKTSAKNPIFQFEDNRPSAVIQRKILNKKNNHPNHAFAIQFQKMAANYFKNRQLPIQAKKNNTGLPTGLKTGIENLSGLSMDDVKVHYNSSKPAQLQALAYAQGTNIHLGPGQEKHLPHEAWHVVQQKQGRVKPTLQMKMGVQVNDDKGLEKEADVMGAKALSASTLQRKELSQIQTQKNNTSKIVQRVTFRLNVGTKHYNGHLREENEWITFQNGGHECWVHIRKSTTWQQQNGTHIFTVKDHIVPYIQNWLNGSLVLYRGVDAGHAVYDEAQQGIAPTKPQANYDIPEFTSDTSLTRFIPYTTSRDIALMATKSSSHEGGDRHGRIAERADEQIGVLLRIKIGTGYTIGIFDPGEIQVLAPPVARVIPVTGTTLQQGFRLDRQPLDIGAIRAHLRERLSDPMWGSLGKALIGHKVPSGVQAMRTLLQNHNIEGVLDLGHQKEQTQDARRHPETQALYEEVKLIRQRLLQARTAALEAEAGSDDEQKSESGSDDGAGIGVGM